MASRQGRTPAGVLVSFSRDFGFLKLLEPQLQSECIAVIQVVFLEPFVAREAESLVQSQGAGVAELRLQHHLWREHETYPQTSHKSA